MEQKDYKLEILKELAKKSSHARELAKLLGTNHMTVSRKIKELEKENVLDYHQEGKNKRYFIKKTAEARNYLLIMENYKLNKLIKKYPSLRKIVEKVQADPTIPLAVIFGSYAKAIAKEDSDIDVYIETKKQNIKKELSMIDSRLSIKIGKYNRSNLLIREIEKNHVIIKGAENYYEKIEFFS